MTLRHALHSNKILQEPKVVRLVTSAAGKVMTRHKKFLAGWMTVTDKWKVTCEFMNAAQLQYRLVTVHFA